MWKKRLLCLALVLCAILLTACQQEEKVIYPEERPTPTPTAVPKPAEETDPVSQTQTNFTSAQMIDFDLPQNNPEAEEIGQDEEIILTVTSAPATPAPIMNSSYAGATPVLIDPIDKPTPTPIPQITFKESDYTTYEATELHLTFQGPVGWKLEGPTGWSAGSDVLDTYTLTNPDESMDYAAQIRIRVSPVNKQLSNSELTTEVIAARDSVRNELKFATFEKYDTASYNFIKVKDENSSSDAPKYSFIKNKGVYTRYKGTLKENDAKVAGRVIVNCYNKTLYILSASYPGGELQSAFEDVYRKVRDTLTLQ